MSASEEADRRHLARVGRPDEDEPIWVWSNEGYVQTCRACGAAYEGTAGATNDHWKECVGICAYAQAVRFGVDKALAATIALEVQRTSGMPPTLAKAREVIEKAWDALGTDSYTRRWASLGERVSRHLSEGKAEIARIRDIGEAFECDRNRLQAYVDGICAALDGVRESGEPIPEAIARLREAVEKLTAENGDLEARLIETDDDREVS